MAPRKQVIDARQAGPRVYVLAVEGKTVDRNVMPFLALPPRQG